MQEELQKYVLQGLHICTKPNLLPLASQDKHNTEVMSPLLCPGCLGFLALLILKVVVLRKFLSFPVVVEDKVEGYKKTTEAVLPLKLKA